MPPWESVYWGWLKSNFSEIAAEQKSPVNIVKDRSGDRAFSHRDIVEIEKLPKSSFSFKSAFQVFIPLHGKELLFFIITFLAGGNNVTLRTSSTA